jgi:hypothetical protein
VFKSGFYLSEEEYIELLTWQMTNRYGQFNDLIVSHPELYAVINGCIRGVWGEFDIISPVATPIFAVELTGIQRDAKIVLGDQPISNTTWEQNEQNNLQNSVLAIEENILTFFYQCSADGTVRSKHLNNVDALAVEEMLGVDSYQAIAEWITANAKGKEGVDMFQNMLDKNGIAYEIEENCYNI